jgi:hypothetical protein
MFAAPMTPLGRTVAENPGRERGMEGESLAEIFLPGKRRAK